MTEKERIKDIKNNIIPRIKDNGFHSRQLKHSRDYSKRVRERETSSLLPYDHIAVKGKLYERKHRSNQQVSSEGGVVR